MSTAVADQPITVDDDPMINRVLAAKYRIEVRIGAGSMGAIYRARHLTLDKVVCVKVMHEDAARVSVLAQRFEREARAASLIDHPNSVRILDRGKERDGTMYIVMEFLDGRDLFDLLADGPFAPERVVDIMAQTLSALAAAHDVGILHRDLKPENIMVTSAVADDGSRHERVKVCDFGIAQVVEPDVLGDGRRITSKGFIVGTPEYMSPEQARGEATDARSDLYSVGVVMFQLLTGRLPFEAETAVGVALKQLGEEPPRPRELNAAVHPVLEEICLRAIRKLPAERYANAREMRSAVCAALETASSARRSEERDTLTEGLAPTETETDAFALPLLRAARSRQSRSQRRPLAVFFAASAVLGVSGLGFAQRHELGPTTVAVATAAAALLDTAKLPAARESSRHASPPLLERVTPDVPEAASPPAATAAHVVARSTRPDVEPAPLQLPSPPPLLPPTGAPAPVDAPPPRPPPPSPARTVATVQVARPPARAEPVAPRYNLDVAHVDVGSPVQVSGATRLALEYAIAPTRPKLDACYRDALPHASGALDGVATLHVETDDVGVVRRANVAGALASDVGPCIARAVIGGRVRNVDTGVASADVPLTYRPR